MNYLKEMVRRGQVPLGLPVMEFATPGLMAILDAAEADFVLLDMEHGCFGIDTIRRVLATARGLDVTPIVRVPYGRYEYISRVLDSGARGVMVPRVENAAEMAAVASAAHYPPEGIRGAAYGIAHDDFTPGDPVAKMRQANEGVLVIAMIESAEGLANVEAIAADPGVDVLWIGHYDLSASLGIPGRIDDPQMVAAFDAVRDAAMANGKIAGRGVMTPGAACKWVDAGYRMFTYSRDIELMRSHLTRDLSECRAGFAEQKELSHD
ncbi:MAG: HpcH/HpaI aldolase family protein [Acidimicrobiales bacterium]